MRVPWGFAADCCSVFGVTVKLNGGWVWWRVGELCGCVFVKHLCGCGVGGE